MNYYKRREKKYNRCKTKLIKSKKNIKQKSREFKDTINKTSND